MKSVGGTIGSYRQALERIARPDHTSAIHVQFPSYRDCELKNTILALRGMAADPERVHIAVCCQGDGPETLQWLDAVPDLAYAQRFDPQRKTISFDSLIVLCGDVPAYGRGTRDVTILRLGEKRGK